MRDWVTLRKNLGILQSGEYAPTPRNLVTVCMFNCPTCGMHASISKNYHSVNYLGEIHPMVACPGKCGFSNWVVLEDWVPESKGQA